MKSLNKKKLIIFDLDGVIFDSKKNMKLAWNKTSKKFNLNVKFEKYFEKIGMPFLNIKPDKKIYRFFQKVSFKEIDKINLYDGVTEQLKFLKEKRIKFSIVTSKDLKRSSFLLRKFKIKPNSIHCPNNTLRGKPYPDHLLYCLKKNKINRNDAYYVGDTEIDYLAAKRANISFIFAKYGFGKNNRLYKNKISKFKHIKNFL